LGKCGLGFLESPVPKGEGPVAPSAWFEKITETGATRHLGSIS
jgi:hypothetical protein